MSDFMRSTLEGCWLELRLLGGPVPTPVGLYWDFNEIGLLVIVDGNYTFFPWLRVVSVTVVPPPEEKEKREDSGRGRKPMQA